MRKCPQISIKEISSSFKMTMATGKGPRLRKSALSI
jgi:hypothetical protein